jgi:hypothetical protein
MSYRTTEQAEGGKIVGVDPSVITAGTLTLDYIPVTSISDFCLLSSKRKEAFGDFGEKRLEAHWNRAKLGGPDLE